MTEAIASLSLGGATLPIARFTGKERLSELYRFDVVAHAGEDAPLPGGLLHAAIGARATLRLERPLGMSRVVHGLITRAKVDVLLPGERGYAVHARLVPMLWIATRRRANRVFEDVTAQEVVQLLLGPIELPMEWRSTSTGSRRAYRVQYEETDFAFLRRVLAEDSLVFSFGQGDETETLFIDDQKSGRPPIETPDGDGKVPYERDGGFATHAEHVATLGLERRVSAARFVARDHDYHRAKLAIEEAARAQGSETEVQLLTEQIEADPRFRDEFAGRGEAKRRLAEARRRARRSWGTSSCRGLTVGHVVHVEQESGAAAFYLTEVDHEGESPALTGRKGEEPVYRNRFVCVPENAEVLVAGPARPRAPSIELATVVGAGEIETDPLGRVRVRFHWDRGTEGNAHRSCWVRVNQSWGGAGFGQQWLPRVGMEVLVGFVAGDLEQPVVMGTVYDPSRPTPFGGQEHAATLGIRTRSTPGGDGFHELSFDDRKGNERVYLRSERDLSVLVQQDRREDVRRNEAVSIGGDRKVVVAGNDVERVQGAATRVVAGDARTAHLGRASETTLGDRTAEVGGVDRRFVHGGVEERVYGAVRTAVDGGVRLDAETSETVLRGSSTTRVGDSVSVSVGTADKGEAFVGVAEKARLQTPYATIDTSKGLTLMAGTTRIELRPEGILLVCGNSRVSLTPGHVSVEGNLATVYGGEARLGNGKAMVVAGKDDLLLHAPSIGLYADQSSLELKANADLSGVKVRLNPPKQDRTPPPPELGGAKVKEDLVDIVFVVLDGDLAPIGHAKYELDMPGEDVRLGRTGGDGRVKTTARRSTPGGEFRIWMSDEEIVTFQLRFDSAKPVTELAGLQQRLANAGVYEGPIDGVSTPAVRDAIVVYQRSRGLEVTGEPDDKLTKDLAPYAKD